MQFWNLYLKNFYLQKTSVINLLIKLRNYRNMKNQELLIVILILILISTIGCKGNSNEVITESGLRYEILKHGSGMTANEGNEVRVHEKMSYLNGMELYSTDGKNNLPKILIGGGQAIEGVDKGIRGMRVGEIRRLIVPPALSKRRQYPEFLSPDSTLVYEIELIEIIKLNKSQKRNKIKKGIRNKSGFSMVFVKGGEYTMGGNDVVDDGGSPESRIADECPHLVIVEDFYIGKYEVTQTDWIEIMGTTSDKTDECDDCPINLVSWDDIQEFIKKVNIKYSENYRLPTEEEWEFAAKGGLKSKGYTYSGSNNVGEVAWYSKNSENKPQSVGMLRSNELGIHDMSGNIWEWCSNSKKPYICDSINNELKFESKVLRGGTFGNRKESVRVNDRNGRNSSLRLKTLGFRLAK